MKYLQSINEFWNPFKKSEVESQKVQLDEKGWVKLSERQPTPTDILQSTNSYRIDDSGERSPFMRGRGALSEEPMEFEYKILKGSNQTKNGTLTYDQNGWYDSSTRERVDDQLDRMGEIYWYDFTNYKKKMEEIMDDKGYMVGLPVVVVKIDRKLKDLKGPSKSQLSEIYKRKLINQTFIIKTTKIAVTDSYIYGGVFISSDFGDWMMLDEIKPLQ